MPAKSEATVQDFCDILEKNQGDLFDACHRYGVTLGWLKRWMKEDPAVGLSIEDAMDSGAAGLENEAIRRAVHGVDEDVYHKGEVVGQKKVYSDAMLALLLKGRKKQIYGTTDVNVNTSINIQKMSDAEIEQRIAALITAQTPEVVEGEFVEVHPEPVPGHIPVSGPQVRLEDLL